MPGIVRSQEHWQGFLPSCDALRSSWQDYYDAPLRNGSAIRLPLRNYGEFALAGFVANQASFRVVDTLVGWIAEDVRGLQIDVVVGLPTIGHVIGAGVARALGHDNWIAPGMTRKFWYDTHLSCPTRSVTSPDGDRRVWLDPRLLTRLQAARRVLLVDDVISTGSSARAGIALLERAGVKPVAVAVAMLQSTVWRAGWDASIPVVAAFSTPLFRPTTAAPLSWEPQTAD